MGREFRLWRSAAIAAFVTILTVFLAFAGGFLDLGRYIPNLAAKPEGAAQVREISDGAIEARMVTPELVIQNTNAEPTNEPRQPVVQRSTVGPSAPQEPRFEAQNLPQLDAYLLEQERARRERIQAAYRSRLTEGTPQPAQAADQVQQSQLTQPVSSLLSNYSALPNQALQAPAGQTALQSDVITANVVTGGRPAKLPKLDNTILARGSSIPITLLNNIDTALPGLVKARVSHDVFDTLTGRRVLIPRGAIVIGSYGRDVSEPAKRLRMVWDELRFPDGTRVQLPEFGALGADGSAGVKGQRSTGFATALGATFLLNLANSAGGQQSAGTGDLSSLLTGAAGSSLSSVGASYVENLLNQGTRFKVPAGTSMQVSIESDVRFDFE
jgi:type IV secretion system protein VirB10